MDCMECGRTITHPICDECLATEFAAWLADIDPLLQERFVMEHLTRDVADDYGSTCVVCRNTIAVCPACAVMQFTEWLRNTEIPPKVVEWMLDHLATRPDGHFVIAQPVLGKRMPLLTLDVRTAAKPATAPL